MTAIVSAAYWLFVLVAAFVMFPIALVVWLVTAPFDRRKVILHGFTNVWAGLYSWANPLWTVRVIGRDRIARGQTYVMVANHCSVVDIFVIHRLMVHFKWVSKIENFRIPLIGWNMGLNGYVALRRGDRESVLRMLAACKRLLGEHSSIMMFPEGTRSKTAHMKPFKPGAFELAIETGVPLLPIAVSGTARALPKHGFRVGPSRMRVEVLAPIAATGSAPELAERTRAAIAASLCAAAD
jgi:1-acyl-sn-glycerol-3-phosphate acyltransferase